MPRKSIGDYPANWNEIAKAVKDAAGWKCVRRGEPHDPASGFSLTVHHLDLHPDNCAWWNLAALCQRCHLQIQHKVVMERAWMFEHSDWFKPYLIGYYYARENPDATRDYAQSLLDLPQSWVKENIALLSRDDAAIIFRTNYAP